MKRPISSWKQGRSTKSLLWYLCYLSNKYNLDTSSLYQAFRTAAYLQKSTCGPLLIECRNKDEENMIFLIQEGTKFLSQQRISHNLFEDQALLKIYNRLELPKDTIKKARKYHAYFY